MRDEEIRKLVDKGRKLKEKLDNMESELEKIKKTLRNEAKLKKADHFLGESHFARVGPHTVNQCDPHELEAMFTDLDRHAEFYDCIKVQIGEAKTRLGETVLGSIMTSESTPYKKVSFLKAIPKKYLE
jgi:hypothetical protein